MITINTTSTSLIELGKPIYTTKCPRCNEQFSVCMYPKYVCSYCYMAIPDILGIANVTRIRLSHYFNKNFKKE